HTIVNNLLYLLSILLTAIVSALQDRVEQTHKLVQEVRRVDLVGHPLPRASEIIQRGTASLQRSLRHTRQSPGHTLSDPPHVLQGTDATVDECLQLARLIRLAEEVVELGGHILEPGGHRR